MNWDWVGWILSAFLAIGTGMAFYFLWDRHSGRSEDSPVKVFLLFAPAFWVIFVIMGGWGENFFLPVGEMALFVLSTSFLLTTVLLGAFNLFSKLSTQVFWILLVSIHAACLVSVIFFMLVRFYSPLSVQMAVWLADLNPESFWAKWFQINVTDTAPEQVVTLFDRLLLALLSYLPLSVLRFVMQHLRLRKILRQVSSLNQRLTQLEEKIHSSE